MKKHYISLELTILKIKDDVVRTSGEFTPGNAPDVYEQDPFTEN